jgi:hypothetical protein
MALKNFLGRYRTCFFFFGWGFLPFLSIAAGSHRSECVVLPLVCQNSEPVHLGQSLEREPCRVKHDDRHNSNLSMTSRDARRAYVIGT